MFCRELEVGDKVVLQVDQQPEGDTGVVIWDAALVLANYLELLTDRLSGRRLVELGSGTGAVGLAAAALGADVLLSDLEENFNLLNHNINKNKIWNLAVEAIVLKWGDLAIIDTVLERKVDFILLADCVYYEEGLEDLVLTLEKLSSLETEIIVSYEDRDSEQKVQLQKRFRVLMTAQFLCSEVPLEEQHQEYRSPDIHILKFRRKQ